MHYVEYIYLVSALMILCFMLVERNLLSSSTHLQLGLAAGAFIGMYFYRRKQRINREQMLEEEMRKLNEEEETA